MTENEGENQGNTTSSSAAEDANTATDTSDHRPAERLALEGVGSRHRLIVEKADLN